MKNILAFVSGKPGKLSGMLLRHFISFEGRISLNRYRAFLLWYFLAVLPIFFILLFALLALGWGPEAGFLHRTSSIAGSVAIAVYVGGCLWPLAVATTRRMHDLGYRARDYLFLISPRKSFRLTQEILFRKGEARSNEFGSDPGHLE